MWGRSGHCSGSAWYAIAENGRSLFFSGDYYDCARVHARDPIEGLSADLAVLDCDYGMQPGSSSRDAQVNALIEAVLTRFPTEGRSFCLCRFLDAGWVF